MEVRYLLTMKAMAMISDSPLEISQDDLEFLRSDNVWLANERNRARRAIESVCYGALDLVGIPRIALPAEFIAAGIVKFVSPVNFMLAAAVMEGAEWSDEIILESDKPISARVLFAHVLRVYGGLENEVKDAERKVAQRAQRLGASAPDVVEARR